MKYIHFVNKNDDLIRNVILNNLSHYFYYSGDGTGKNNVYTWKNSMLYTITEQQQINKYNLSYGLLTQTHFGSNKEFNGRDDEEQKDYKQIEQSFLMTYEIHVFSCQIQMVDVKAMANIVRTLLAQNTNCKQIDPIMRFYYKELDNTNKALYDCVFTATVLHKDIFRIYDVEPIESLELKDTFFLDQDV